MHRNFWGIFGRARTCLIALPTIYAVVLLLGPWVIDPLKIYGGGIVRQSGQIIPGYSTIDPNVAFNSYALGSVAAKQLVALQLPLWNHFEGFGQPLLGETQSAALFPLTLLLLFPAGQVIAHAILQIIGGLGMFALGRNLHFGVRTSFVVALAFEFSSLFVWLKNAMINPIPFLVWLLVYTLRLVRSSPDHLSRIDVVGLGITAGFAVLGGFPETVLIFSFYLLAWVAFYFFSGHATWPATIALLKKLAIATLIAFCIAAPALVALGIFAPEAYLGSHADGGFRDAHLSSHALSKYVFPYLSGPIFGYPVPDEIGRRLHRRNFADSGYRRRPITAAPSRESVLGTCRCDLCRDHPWRLANSRAGDANPFVESHGVLSASECRVVDCHVSFGCTCA